MSAINFVSALKIARTQTRRVIFHLGTAAVPTAPKQTRYFVGAAGAIGATTMTGATVGGAVMSLHALQHDNRLQKAQQMNAHLKLSNTSLLAENTILTAELELAECEVTRLNKENAELKQEPPCETSEASEASKALAARQLHALFWYALAGKMLADTCEYVFPGTIEYVNNPAAGRGDDMARSAAAVTIFRANPPKDVPQVPPRPADLNQPTADTVPTRGA